MICLSHSAHESYDNYIKRCATNADAILVKMSDLRHNSDLRRLKGLKAKDIERATKYMRSYEYLRMVRDAHKAVYS